MERQEEEALTGRLVQIIEQFLADVSIAHDMLLVKTEGIRPLKAWREGTVSRRGKLRHRAGYEFHGVGCRVLWDGRRVDFDYGPEGRIDGFDLWRLQMYLQDNADRIPPFPDLEWNYKTALAEDVIVPMCEDGSSRLHILPPAQRD